MTAKEMKQILTDLEMEKRDIDGEYDRIADLQASIYGVGISDPTRSGGSSTFEGDRFSNRLFELERTRKRAEARQRAFSEAWERVERALSAVPNAEARRVIRLRYGDGLRFPDIAERIGDPDADPNNTLRRIFRRHSFALSCMARWADDHPEFFNLNTERAVSREIDEGE